MADPDDPLAKGEILIEPPQPAPRVPDDQGLRGGETPKTTDIAIEFRVTVADENPPESGPTLSNPTGDQPNSSTRLNAPDEQENT